MSEVRDFLDIFKTKRKFKPLFPRLKTDPEFRNALFSEIALNEYPYAEYASWIAQHFYEHTRSDLSEWKQQFIDLLQTTRNHTVQRNLMHIFTRVKANVQDDGEFLSCMLAHFENPESLPALKVNAFKAIEKQYLRAHPELLSEVKLLMDLHANDERPSIQAMRRNFQKRYAKQLLQLR
jgi:hypothetical protein